MKRALLAALFSCAALNANAGVLTFDDVPGAVANGVGHVGSYAGFNFSSTFDWIDTVGSSWNYGAVSGEFTLLNDYGGVGVITAVGGVDFTFDGMWAETWANQGPRTGTVRGYNNGALVWSSNVALTSQFQHFGGIAGAIDELHLDLGNYFLVDNLALNDDAAPIPEPASIALLGLGLAGLALSKRRKQA